MPSIERENYIYEVSSRYIRVNIQAIYKRMNKRHTEIHKNPKQRKKINTTTTGDSSTHPDAHLLKELEKAKNAGVI